MGVLRKREMIEHITTIGPIVLVAVVYFVRLETRITKIITDLCWIKKEIEGRKKRREK